MTLGDLKRWLADSRVGIRLKQGRNWFRNLGIRTIQAGLLRLVPSDTKRLIIFLTPGIDHRSGGVLAIGNHYRESRVLSHVHAAKVVLCTVPKDPLFLKYTWFKNANYILSMGAVVRQCTGLEWLLIHMPEYAVNQFITGLGSDERAALRRIKSVQLNVMLQNIDLIQNQRLSGLAEYGRVTCTTAHEAYTTMAIRQQLGVPLHKLSIYVHFNQYIRTPYERKQSLLIVSPDPHPLKARVLRKIAAALPHTAIQIINNLSYEDYRRLVSRAKWSLTFGEGLDGYYAEPILSGGVGFAVFNDRFFTPDYAAMETIYPSWDTLEQQIIHDLRRLDEPNAYRRCSQQARELLCQKYNNEEYRENLRRFYQDEFSYP